MVGIGRRAEVCFMAGVAIGWRGHILVVHMARSTRHRYVHAGERIVCIRVVVELRIEPIRCGVANAAVVGHPGRYVGRVVGPREIGLMTGEAGCRRALELVVEMTGSALQRGMHSRQGVSGYREMIELRSKPGIHRVARLARGRKCRVIGNCGLEILLVA